MIRVMVVDDHAVVRSGLEQLLATAPDVELVASATNGQEALDRAADEEPDVVLMDLAMPELDGVEATRQMVAAHPDTNVVVLTSFSDNKRIMDALRADNIEKLREVVAHLDLSRIGSSAVDDMFAAANIVRG